MLSKVAMVTFGLMKLPRFLPLAEIISSLVAERSVNYKLLMPLILFLPSCSSTEEFLRCVIEEYEGSSSSGEEKKMNCLVILICWLRESSAHSDFECHEDKVTLKDFLSRILSNENDHCGLCAASRKLQRQLSTVMDEQLDLKSCLDIYQTDLKQLYVLPRRSATNDEVCKELEEVVAHGGRSSSHSAPVTKGDHTKNLKIVATDKPSCDIDTADRSGVCEQFPELDRLGRRRPKDDYDCDDEGDEKTPKSSSALRSKRNHETVVQEIRSQDSHLQNYSTPLELAINLTLLELHCGILTLRPRELTSLRWTQASLKLQHPDMGGCYHLHRYIQHTNQRVYWVAHEVLIRGYKTKSFEECLRFFILTAENAFKLNNFNTVFQIIEGLKLPAIKRLASWESLSASKMETYEALCAFFDPSNNYARYRQHVRSLGSQARIPCLSILLKDITLVEMSSPWRRDDGKGGMNYEIDLQKMETLFNLLSRDLFSLRSSFITSFYTSRILCRIHVNNVDGKGRDDDIARKRRGRASRIDSRSGDYTEDFFMKCPLPEVPTSIMDYNNQIETDFYEEEGEDDCVGDDKDGYYVLVYMSHQNGAMEDNFFDDMEQDVTCSSRCWYNSSAIAVPTSDFLTLSSCFAEPLFSLKMKKQIQSQEKPLNAKIQRQMNVDIDTSLSSRGDCRKDRRRISLGDDGSASFGISPLKKKKPDVVDYPEPIATIPFMSITQDAVQSYAHVIDEQVINNMIPLDSPLSRTAATGHKEERNLQNKAFLSIFGSGCSGREGNPLFEGNTSTNIALTAYDQKVVQLLRNVMRVHADTSTLWEWSKAVSGEGKNRLLRGIAKVGLA